MQQLKMTCVSCWAAYSMCLHCCGARASLGDATVKTQAFFKSVRVMCRAPARQLLAQPALSNSV
jgi:hypothetical protein